jgi:arylsulfatase A
MKHKLLPWILGLMVLPLIWEGCTSEGPASPPNVILIMADDMGVECLGTYGSLSYQTPHLDELAARGIRFENCIAQPLCTPSRVKIMTGLYNYRNYGFFGHLGLEQTTFGTLMKAAGYSTCIAGKWQLNGLSYKEQITDWNDPSRPVQLGFDEYCLWQLTRARKEGERYANPLIECNGELLEGMTDAYGPDVFAAFVMDFIERHKDGPFFIYYPMVLVHDPFVPTPDSESWPEREKRYQGDTAYFKEMVAYADLIVGQIVSTLEATALLENTVLIFTGDNGTHPSIYSRTASGLIRGGKGNTTDAGTHVPLIVHYPEGKQTGVSYQPLIEFSDFYPTLAEIAGQAVDGSGEPGQRVDGQSFFPVLTGSPHVPRESAFVHYDPKWGRNVNQYRNQFVRTLDYKLYSDGRFFDLNTDVLEQQAISRDSFSETEAEVYQVLQGELARHPAFLSPD